MIIQLDNILDDEWGSNAHEPTRLSFRMPASYNDDEEGYLSLLAIYNEDLPRFRPYGVMELELYQHHTPVYGRSETTTSLMPRTCIARITKDKRLYASKGMNIYTNGLLYLGTYRNRYSYSGSYQIKAP